MRPESLDPYPLSLRLSLNLQQGRRMQVHAHKSPLDPTQHLPSAAEDYSTLSLNIYAFLPTPTPLIFLFISLFTQSYSFSKLISHCF